MVIKSLFLLIVIGVAVAYEDVSVINYLAKTQGFSLLVTSLTNAGLNATLDTPNGPFTIFAPTNTAFIKLGSSLSTLTASQLELILKYHVVSGFVLAPQITGERNITTVANQPLTLDRDGQGGIILNNASQVTETDVIVNNGVVHTIDTLLMPPVLPTLTIDQLLLQDDARFKDLFLALLLADLVDILDQSEYTLFAPIDAAFAVYKDNLLSPNAPNAQAIYQEVLKYHVVPGARMASQLSNGQQLFTLHGTPINITIGAGAMVNNANVIDADILATNGVIHAIDRLLIPGDINQIAQG